ncbi:MAG TPA: hypothetical protein VF524_02285 [Polyangia bacterium]
MIGSVVCSISTTGGRAHQGGPNSGTGRHGESQGLPWFAMELVEGPTLAARLAKGPLDFGEAPAIFARLLDALGHAHEHGVMQHRLVAEGFDFRPGDA